MGRGFGTLNHAFKAVSDGYSSLIRRLLRLSVVVLIVYCGLLALAGIQFARTQQKGTPTWLVFGAAALFVFLVLAAQYESLKIPLAVVLIVPMCLLASVTGLRLRGF